jgi:prepilin-type N-terminal cleavage/methylation domain-containing protein
MAINYKNRQLPKKMQNAKCKMQNANSQASFLPPASRILHPHRGMTLIELLVVIVILTTVVAAAIPIMAPSNVDRQLREASRGLNTFITGAQARAIASGRPYGIALKRLSQETDNDANPDNPHDDNGVCLEVFYVEEQPPYTGFDRNSRACLSLNLNNGLVTIQFVTRGKQYPPNQDRLPIGWDPDLFPSNTIRPGDVIEIGTTRYELGSGDQQRVGAFVDTKTGFYVAPQQAAQFAVSISARPINDTGQQFNPEYDNRGNELGTVPQRNPPYWTRPLPYKIYRQGTITSDEPYQMPEGTAIDLRASGIGGSVFFHNPQATAPGNRIDNSRPVIIMFTPEGRIGAVSLNWSQSTSFSTPDKLEIVEDVFLLVGRRENIPAPPVASDPTLTAAGVPVVGALNRDEAMSKLKESINWLNGDSRWLVLGAQSGRVVTIENGFVDPLIVMNQNSSGPNPVAQSSEPLRNQQILAAREFAPEMRQLGGR